MVACERRRISGCRFSPPKIIFGVEKRLYVWLHVIYETVIRLRSLASRMAGHVSHLNLVVWPRSPRVFHSSVVRASNRHLEGHGFDSLWEDSEVFSEYST